MLVTATVVGVLMIGLVALFWRPRAEEEEFVLTLPADAPTARAGGQGEAPSGR
jgi:hypothetical protein